MTATACAAESQAPDADSNLHCTVLSFQWMAHAEQNNVGAAKIDAAQIMYNWYLKTARAEHGDAFEAKAEPLLKAFANDLDKAKEAYEACVIRASNDPEFTRFLKSRTSE